MRALRAELVKLAGLPAWWLAVALTVAVPAAVAALTGGATGWGHAMPLALTGCVLVGLLPVTHEYAGGQFRVSLTVVPRRGRWWLAKLAAVVLTGSVTAVLTTGAVGLVSGTTGPGWRAAGALLLAALLAHTVAAALRGLLATAATALLLLLVLPVLLPEAGWLPGALATRLLTVTAPEVALLTLAGWASWLVGVGLVGWWRLLAHDA